MGSAEGLDSQSRPDQAKLSVKRSEIIAACERHDVAQLRLFAASAGGLESDICRVKAWPILLGCDTSGAAGQADWQELERHHDEDQVQLDVNRSFVYYPEGLSEVSREAWKTDLSHTIVAVLRQHPTLHYFQGYHDIVQVLLLVLGKTLAIPAAARLSLLRIRDYMLPTMTGTEAHLQLLPAILSTADAAVCAHLSHTRPFFALAATLTLYAHDIEEYGDIARLFDFLLASEAVVPLYMFAVIVVSRREELLDIPSDEPEMLHSILSKLPKPLDLDRLIQQTLDLFARHPPETLPGRSWSRIPSSSVLKTTRRWSALEKQTLADGERFLAQEAAEIRRREAFQERQRRLQIVARRYWRPATWTGAALLVAFAALYLRDSSIAASILERTGSLPRLRQVVFNVWQQVMNFVS